MENRVVGRVIWSSEKKLNVGYENDATLSKLVDHWTANRQMVTGFTTHPLEQRSRDIEGASLLGSDASCGPQFSSASAEIHKGGIGKLRYLCKCCMQASSGIQQCTEAVLELVLAIRRNVWHR
eukprot:5590666-Ditylum_brightwellii.AAC.1